jgi:uncharacterized coiled-coil protein SlyX
MTYKTKNEILQIEMNLSNLILDILNKRLIKLKTTFEFNSNMLLNPNLQLTEKVKIIKEISQKQNHSFVKKLNELETACIAHERNIFQFALDKSDINF